MATIAEQLTNLANTKTAIKDAIVAKGVEVADTDPFSAYAGKIEQIQTGGGGAPATRFGVSIDNLLGDVDAEGNYIAPTDGFVLDLTGVKHVPVGAFEYLFMAYEVMSGANMRLTDIIANDVVSVGSRAFSYVSAFNTALNSVCFDGIEEIIQPSTSTGNYFFNAFHYAKSASFKKLKRIDNDVSAAGAFDSAFTKTNLDFDSVFPSLEYVRGGQEFAKLFQSSSSKKIKLYASKIHTCIQNTRVYNVQNYSVFVGIYGDIYMPRCTRVERGMCRTTYACNLHFATAHQADIEACEGYDYLFGAKEIYFDLMLNITVNGVVYSREYTIGGYTSWKDTDGNIVYTDATAEPAVGTVVYSDQGTTQVGTVSEVA